VLGAILVLAAAALGATALAGAGYTDPPGDSSQALDIRTITISETPDARLTFAVEIVGRPQLEAGSRIDIWFDLDNNQSTGDEGDEALARYQAGAALQFYRWVDGELVRRPTSGMSGSYAGGTYTFFGPMSALDRVSSFGALVITRGAGVDEDVYAFDAAPDRGRLAYVSPGPASETDAVGDVPVAADLTSVKVTDGKDGTITFSIAFVGEIPTTMSAVDLGIDRDLLPNGRVEVVLGYESGKFVLRRWDAGEDEWVDDAPPTRAHATVTGPGKLVLTVHRSELDDVARFGFAIASSVEDEDETLEALDRAPDQRFWGYTLAHRPPLRLIVDEIYASPTRPRAGEPLTVYAPVRRSDTSRPLTSGSVSCKVRSAGRAIRAVGSLKAGRATCALRVPRSAVDVRGSMLIRSGRVSVTAWFAGAIDFSGGIGG
jgi:hypothetical protein